ncbi:MAG: insulinase family protein [Clostridia bacterium]|nr:insulinase family protein [Clostridia bacterium]
MAFYKKLDNGIRIVIYEMPEIMSVNIGIAVNTGGAFETDAEDGISHYIEHMMFKGTPTRDYLQISEAFDRIGSLSNAYTGKDTTMYYIKSTTEHVEETFDILADFFLNATFPEEEMEKEKSVVIEEIMRAEDDPDDVCQDLLDLATFGPRGYGRNVLGPEENVRGFTKENMRAYMARHYIPQNIVIAMAGNIDTDLAVRMVEKWFKDIPASPVASTGIDVSFQYGSLVRTKSEVKQAHVGICLPAFARNDPMIDAASLLNLILGGGLSSRIYTTVREKMALAYEVESYLVAFRETGVLVITGGFKAARYMDAIDAIFNCMHDLKKEIKPEEFSRAKEQFIASSIYNEESPHSMMTLYCKNLLISDRIYDPAKRIENIKKLTIDDLLAVADRIFVDSKASFALVGPFTEPIPKRA